MVGILGIFWFAAIAIASIATTLITTGISIDQANKQQDLQLAGQKKAEDNTKSLNEKRKLKTDADAINARSQAATGILYSKVMTTRADLEAKNTRAATPRVGRPSHFTGRPEEPSPRTRTIQ